MGGVNSAMNAAANVSGAAGYDCHGHGGYTSTGVILVLFILLVIISRIAWV